MKKLGLTFVFIMLTVVLVMSLGGVAFAEEGVVVAETPVEENSSILELANIIATYAVFLLAIFAGLPIIRRLGRRNVAAYSVSLLAQTENLAARFNSAYDKRGKSADRNVLKLSLAVGLLAERALSAHTSQQAEGYLDVYNRLNGIRDGLLALERKKNADFDVAFKDVKDEMQAVAAQVKFISEREKKISEYNG
jgi:hypothetical protein